MGAALIRDAFVRLRLTELRLGGVHDALPAFVEVDVRAASTVMGADVPPLSRPRIEARPVLGGLSLVARGDEVLLCGAQMSTSAGRGGRRRAAPKDDGDRRRSDVSHDGLRGFFRKERTARIARA